MKIEKLIMLGIFLAVCILLVKLVGEIKRGEHPGVFLNQQQRMENVPTSGYSPQEIAYANKPTWWGKSTTAMSPAELSEYRVYSMQNTQRTFDIAFQQMEPNTGNAFDDLRIKRFRAYHQAGIWNLFPRDLQKHLAEDPYGDKKKNRWREKKVGQSKATPGWVNGFSTGVR